MILTVNPSHDDMGRDWANFLRLMVSILTYSVVRQGIISTLEDVSQSLHMILDDRFSRTRFEATTRCLSCVPYLLTIPGITNAHSFRNAMPHWQHLAAFYLGSFRFILHSYYSLFSTACESLLAAATA
jgi:hypothetical protein